MARNEPLRTSSGQPSQTARTKYGDEQGKFPVFDKNSAESAIKLRGHADDRSAVLDKVSRFASANGHDDIKAKVAEARKEDSGK